YQGRSAHELIAAFGNQPEKSGYEIVRDYWKSRMGAGEKQSLREQFRNSPSDFEELWRRSLHAGFIANTAISPKHVSLKMTWARQDMVFIPSPQPPTPSPQLEIIFRPDPYIHDGRFANNGWLQELPRPITKLTWDNAALISPATAERLGLAYKIS